MTSNTYTITVKDAHGCTNQSIVQLQSLNAPVFNSVSIINLTCAESNDGHVAVNATGNAAIDWYAISPGSTINANGTFSGLPSGIYQITVSDVNGCTNTVEAELQSPLPLLFDHPLYLSDSCGSNSAGRLICYVKGGTGAYSFVLNPGNVIAGNNGTYENLGAGNYTITVHDANNCSSVTNIQIAERICCENVFIPNAFSPNGDGLNDEFSMKGTNGIELVFFRIYNRWGQVVFEAQNLFDSWNGNYKGTECDLGTYYYEVRYRCLSSNQIYFKKGDLILIR